MRGTQRSLLHVRLMGSWVRTWSFTQWRRALRRIRVAGNVGVVGEVCGDGLGAHFVPVGLRELASQMRWIFSSVMRRSVSLVNSWKCLHAPLKGLDSGE